MIHGATFILFSFLSLTFSNEVVNFQNQKVMETNKQVFKQNKLSYDYSALEPVKFHKVVYDNLC
jgi:hypothetical protein